MKLCISIQSCSERDLGPWHFTLLCIVLKGLIHMMKKMKWSFEMHLFTQMFSQFVSIFLSDVRLLAQLNCHYSHPPPFIHTYKAKCFFNCLPFCHHSTVITMPHHSYIYLSIFLQLITSHHHFSLTLVYHHWVSLFFFFKSLGQPLPERVPMKPVTGE